MKLIAAALLVLAGTVSGVIFSEVNLMQHLEKLYEHRYPSETNHEAREKIKNYIFEQFKYYGLEVVKQRFNTTVSENPTGLNAATVTVEGTNIIGMKKAATKQPGAVVVVGADYDSTGLTDPLFFNGAGVAALLETAHIYAFNADWSGPYKPNFTTIFVAFDINTRHYKSSSGRPGGYYFVKEWLWPFIEKNSEYFGGAVILDSVMNVNYEPNSQTLSSGSMNVFIDTYNRVIEHQNKGDFLAMVSLGGSTDSKNLKDQYSAGYNRDRRGKRYRLENMELENGMSLDPLVELFLESENVHFWTFKDDSNKHIHLPAILLTDTSEFRPDPKESCPNCRPVDFLTEDRLEFVNATVRGTTHFLLDRQATMLPKTDSSATSRLPSILMTVLMMTLVRLYM